MKTINIIPNAPIDQLFALVKSLSKAEKRNFKLYATRSQSNENLKFIQLFDLIDKMKEYDESFFFKKMKGLTKPQLANLKRHLYKQILASLRLIHIPKNIEIQIREQLDYSRILYNKGLYLQSLKLLERTKGMASSQHFNLLYLEVIEFQKLIEERHITRSRTVKGKVDKLLNEATQTSKIINHSCELTNLKITIHGYYIRKGHIKSSEDRAEVEKFFEEHLARIELKDLSFFEMVYLYQAYVWYYFILLDFENCFDYALKWVSPFNEQPNIKQEDPDLYLRGLHYVITSLYNLRREDEMKAFMEKFDSFSNSHTKKLNTISKTLIFLYGYNAKINHSLLKRDYQSGIALIPWIERNIQKYRSFLDTHRIMVFYYKIANLHLGAKNYDAALEYLVPIIQSNSGHLRVDIQGYARILQLLIHYDLKSYDFLSYLVPSTKRFLDKMEDLNKLQKTVLNFFGEMPKLSRKENHQAFLDFKEKLVKIQADPYEKRSFLYLDIMSWIDKHLSVEQVIV